jgi:hypothetical protein
MHRLRHRDLVHRDLVHRLVRDLAFLESMVRLNGMDHLKMVHLFRCVVDIVNLNQVHLQDVEKMDELQIRDEQNLDVVPTFQDVVRRFLADEQVGVEPRHQLKMDYCQDVVDAELHHLTKTDYCQGVVLALVLLPPEHSHLNSVVLEPVELVLPLQLLPLHVQP